MGESLFLEVYSYASCKCNFILLRLALATVILLW
jgi:hypothetical protein